MSEVQEPFDLAAATEAVDRWLTRFRGAFDDWRAHYPLSAPAAEASWLDVLRWHSAFELSFTQLVGYLEDQTDTADAQRALEDAGASITVRGTTLRPLAKERLDALSTDSRDHLLEVHLSRLSSHPYPQDAERLASSADVYRIRAHDCRIVYRLQGEDVLVLTVTPSHRLP